MRVSEVKMIKIYEMKNITLQEAYHLSYFYGYDITVKDGRIYIGV